MPINEIILFCYGDSKSASTWSNVPFLMSRTLEEKGITVHRVDISANQLVSRLAGHAIQLMLSLTGHRHNHEYTFIRSGLFKLLIKQKITDSIRKFPNADYCIFLCFDFYNHNSTIPSLIFSDWTYQMLIEERIGRSLDRYDRKFISQQEEALAHAEIVLPLFSTTYNKLRLQYPHCRIYHPGFNVINCMTDMPDRNKIIPCKLSSDYILFIGGPQYINGLKLLIQSMEQLKKPMKLHIIGMRQDILNKVPEHITFHGYLRKDHPEENALYYRLLSNARIMINPSSLWGAYSSIVEGMFFYTPIIVSPFEQFVTEFGTDINFGAYCLPENAHDLAEKIDLITSLDSDTYSLMCNNAHMAVKDYTWSRFVDYMLSIMSDQPATLN